MAPGPAAAEPEPEPLPPLRVYDDEPSGTALTLRDVLSYQPSPPDPPPRPTCPNPDAPLPRVPDVTNDDYPFTNDVLFGTADDLAPAPVDPPPLPEPVRLNPECAWNPPPAPPVYPRVPATEQREFVYAPGPTRHLTDEVLGLDEEVGSSLGTAVQLASTGPQDVRLHHHPQMTFFRQAYQRHTPFGLQTFADPVALRLGAVTAVEVPRRGDVLGDVMLEVRLPDLGVPGGTWAPAVGYVLMSRARLVVDDVVVHDHERLYYDVLDKLFAPQGLRAALDAMVGRDPLPTDAAHVVYVPFKFFCCRNHWGNRQFLPIGALPRQSRVTLEFTAEALEGCVRLPPGAAAPRVRELAASLLTEQAFLDADERHAARQRPTTVMVETTQDVDALGYTFDDVAATNVRSASLDLREVNLPVRSLMFVVYDENAAAQGRYFEYLDCVRAATLFINSGERFSQRAGPYFSLVQTYQHATRCWPDNVHLYSFALDAAQRQPCGALNFAALDRPQLRVELQNTEGRAVKVKAFAQCLNWLTTDNGVGWTFQ